MMTTEERNHEVMETGGIIKTPCYGSIMEFFEKKGELLTEIGWYVENDPDHLSLHRRFKNGKHLKMPDLSLTYREYIVSILVNGLDGKTQEENAGKRQRPWAVICKGENIGTFGSLEKAAEVFLDLAQSFAPSDMTTKSCP